MNTDEQLVDGLIRRVIEEQIVRVKHMCGGCDVDRLHEAEATTALARKAVLYELGSQW